MKYRGGAQHSALRYGNGYGTKSDKYTSNAAQLYRIIKSNDSALNVPVYSTVGVTRLGQLDEQFLCTFLNYGPAICIETDSNTRCLKADMRCTLSLDG